MSSSKSAVIPAVRVNAEVRQAAESVLYDHESLSAFIAQSVELNIARRKAQDEFISRGLASRDKARATGVYHSADSVLSELDEIFRAASKQAGE
jgi:hypothetical protein